MLNYIARRLLLLVFVLFGVVTLVFFLIHMIPGDPVDIMLGDNAISADKEVLRHSMGLDRPLHEQYFGYLAGVFSGDLGSSVHNNKPVLGEILIRFPASAELMAGAMFFAFLIAVPLGIVSALKPYGLLDGTAMLVSFIGVSMPNFWLGPLLILLFAIQLDWLPVNERGGLAHLILPALTLGASMAAMLSRMIRASLLEVLDEDYVRTARAKGLPERKVILKHAMRNALIPVITIIGLQVGVLLSGAIITESIFDWPGLGSLLLDGIYTRDYPLVQGCILFIAAIYVLVNLVTDIAYAWV
ncbi:MAG: ABC transporter permease, partial [Gammaproteobacteria bacterium]|nr:ABC transporter permease [Gammaproteobacteria bacterium]